MNTRLNKKVKKDLDAYFKGFKGSDPEVHHGLKHILIGALTDANFHSEAKQVQNMFPKAKQSKYYGRTDMEDSIEQNHGEPIAKAAKWDGYEIIDAISFFASMFIGGPVGAKITSLKEGMNENVKMFVSRFIKEVTHSHEYEDMSSMGEDENDKEEIKIGEYQTKYFHVCPGASSLYGDIESKGVDMDMAERSVRLQDALFFIEEHVGGEGYTPDKDYVMVATNIAKNIMKMAKLMGLEKEHSYIQGHVDTIIKSVEGKKLEERVIELTEKNTPTDPAKWAASKAAAKRKFDVYPSAYANAWAAKNYKGKGGGWRTTKESVNEANSKYPNFDLNKNIRYQDTVITNGMWRYTGRESGGAGVYRNLNNDQFLSFDRNDFKYFKKHLKRHFDIDESVNENDSYSITDDKGRHFLLIVGEEPKDSKGKSDYKKDGFYISPQKGFKGLITAYFKDEKTLKKNIDKKYHNQLGESVNESKKLKKDVSNALNILNDLASILWQKKDKRNVVIGKAVDTIERTISTRELFDLEESVNEAKSMDMKKRLKVYDKLKKGDKITIKYGSSMRGGVEKEFVVSKGKTLVGKAQVERIILKNPANPKGVKYYLYQRNGNVTMAIGDMAATIEDMHESVNESLNHNDMYTMLDIAAGYSSTQHEAAGQMWSDEQDLYDYLKSDHIPKKYHKKFYNDIKRRFKGVNESVNEAKEPEVITQLRKIVKNKQNDLIKDTKSGKKVRVDINSANLMVQVYDALKQQSNKDKFVKSGILMMGHTAYKLMKKENTSEVIEEAEYQGRKVELNKPMQGDSKKFKVYVKNEKGNVVVVHFGAKGMNIKKNNPAARKSFRARMNCDNPGPKWKANYWSCRKW